MPANLPYALTVAALIAGPSVTLATIAELRDDPRLRPLSLTEARMAASDALISLEGPYVRARIYWAGEARGYRSAEELSAAIRAALAAKGVDAHVAVIKTAATETMLDMRAGHNAFGPFPVADAARHVTPAAEAARIAYAQRRAEALARSVN